MNKKIKSIKKEIDNSAIINVKSLDMTRELGLKIPRTVLKRSKWYVAYSVQQAVNRGLKEIRPEVKKYIEKDFPEVAKLTRGIYI